MLTLKRTIGLVLFIALASTGITAFALTVRYGLSGDALSLQTWVWWMLASMFPAGGISLGILASRWIAGANKGRGNACEDRL